MGLTSYDVSDLNPRESKGPVTQSPRTVETSARSVAFVGGGVALRSRQLRLNLFRHTLRHRALDQSGANAVEFALLAPIVFAVLFGTIYGGLAWNAQQTLTHAARDGARFGATLADPGTPDWVERVEQRTEEAAVGLTAEQRDNLNIMAVYEEGQLDAEGDPIDPKVRVIVETPGSINLILLGFWDFTISSEAIARHEGG